MAMRRRSARRKNHATRWRQPTDGISEGNQSTRAVRVRFGASEIPMLIENTTSLHSIAFNTEPHEREPLKPGAEHALGAEQSIGEEAPLTVDEFFSHEQCLGGASVAGAVLFGGATILLAPATGGASLAGGLNAAGSGAAVGLGLGMIFCGPDAPQGGGGSAGASGTDGADAGADGGTDGSSSATDGGASTSSSDGSSSSSSSTGA